MYSATKKCHANFERHLHISYVVDSNIMFHHGNVYIIIRGFICVISNFRYLDSNKFDVLFCFLFICLYYYFCIYNILTLSWWNKDLQIIAANPKWRLAYRSCERMTRTWARPKRHLYWTPPDRMCDVWLFCINIVIL